jgi:pimeloyl-ACP methyl ester carboxylesterase
MNERAAVGNKLESVGFGERGLALESVTSEDGTKIAFEKSGDGPPVVILGGGLNEKAMFAKLAATLSHQFTVYNVDRRGRGGSDWTPVEQYAVEREVEDLAAVLEATGPGASVFANCTAGMITIPAAAAGLPMAKLAIYEPPYCGPKVPPGYLPELKRLLAADRRSDAVALFLKEDALFTDEEIVRFKDHPIWPAFEAMAPSTVYDSILSDDADRIPHEQLSKIAIPTLIIGGDGSLPWMVQMCRDLAAGIPKGEFVSMPSEGHLFNQEPGAPLLTEFFLR